MLSLALAACGSRVRASDGSAPPVVMKDAASAQTTSEQAPQEECPVFALAELEPPAPTPDPRTVELSTLIAPPVARTGPIVLLALGELVVRPPTPDKGGWGFGMGWHGLEASWVEAGVSPAIGPAFRVWIAARATLSDEQRRSYLLSKRARYLRSQPAPLAWGAPRCTEEARAQAEVAVRRGEELLVARTESMRVQLEMMTARTPAETFLLAYLLEESTLRVSWPKKPDPAELERVRRMYTQVLDDRAVPVELRARAAEHLAIIEPDRRGPAFERWLERVLALTRDPELRIDTLTKLADVAERPGVEERRRSELIDLLDRQGGGWQLAEQLARRAEGYLARGAYRKAADDAVRCAGVVTADLPDEPDPWGCAQVLAQALAESGEVPKGATVPRAFLGPLALEWMRAAGERRDSDQVRHLGHTLLELAPDAAEAPEALLMLASVEPGEREALLARKARDYGLDSAWYAAQEERLAWRELPDMLAGALDRIAEPDESPSLAAPRSEPEERADLFARANAAAFACVEQLRPGRRIAVEVHTPELRVDIAGARGASAACLRRAVRARFRSLGPAFVAFELRLQK